MLNQWYRKERFFAGILLAVVILVQIFSFGTETISYRKCNSATVEKQYCCSIEKLSNPEMEKHAESNVPEYVENSISGRLVEFSMTRSGRYQTGNTSIRYLTLICLLLLFLYMVFHRMLKKFWHRMIILWENIYYIHRVDGKKGKNTSVILG